MRRDDLADFLRVRRAALRPEDVGLAPGGRRRTAGLRREEVALLAGVSVSWYTWLEQGRPINASLEVLTALGRALRLDPIEVDHLLALAGHPRRRPVESGRADTPDWAWLLVDALDPSPAHVLNPRWDFVAWNAAQERLYPPITTLPPEERNLVWVVFADPATRRLIVDWEAEARRVLSQFRADTTPIRDDPAIVAFVARLRAVSVEFDDWWGRHDVGGFETRLRRYDHPVAGLLTFGYQQLVPAGDPDLRVVAQLALPGDDSASRLAAVPRPAATEKLQSGIT